MVQKCSIYNGTTNQCKNISSCGDNNLYTVYISRFYENLNYRRKYDPLFHLYYIFYISSGWVLILYKSIENWCYKQIKLTPWRCVHFNFVPNFQCSWRDFERTGVQHNTLWVRITQSAPYIFGEIFLYLYFTHIKYFSLLHLKTWSAP